MKQADVQSRAAGVQSDADVQQLNLATQLFLATQRGPYIWTSWVFPMPSCVELSSNPSRAGNTTVLHPSPHVH